MSSTLRGVLNCREVQSPESYMCRRVLKGFLEIMALELGQNIWVGLC